MIPEKCSGTVLIVGETIDGCLSAGSRNLGKQARRLAGRFDGEPVGVLTGHGIEQCGTVLVEYCRHAGHRFGSRAVPLPQPVHYRFGGRGFG